MYSLACLCVSWYPSVDIMKEHENVRSVWWDFLYRNLCIVINYMFLLYSCSLFADKYEVMLLWILKLPVLHYILHFASSYLRNNDNIIVFKRSYVLCSSRLPVTSHEPDVVPVLLSQTHH